MNPDIYEIPLPTAGRLFIMPHPPAEDLDRAMAHYRALDVDQILSMLEPDEANILGLSTEPDAAAAAGLTFETFPITDFGLPPVEPFGALIERLVDDLHQGRNIAVHCRAGIGRSGMVVCSVLGHMTGNGPAAIEQVSKAREHPVPDTEEQRDYILRITP